MKIDYNLKAQIIESGLARMQSQFSKFLYLFQLSRYDNEFSYRGLDNEATQQFLHSKLDDIYYEALYKFDVDLCNQSDYLVQEAYKVNHASYERVKRLRKRVSDLLLKNCLFLTLTFDNDSYDKLSFDTKRKYVQRCLKSLGVPYVANVDYGKKNGRLHYHALVQIDNINHKVWQYGNLDFKRVVVANDTAISKYLDKLTSHAIKETCKSNRLLYSKKSVRIKPSNQ